MYRKFRNVPIFSHFCPYFWNVRVGMYVIVWTDEEILSNQIDPISYMHSYPIVLINLQL